MNSEKNIKPIYVNEDVWFYPTPKGFEFVVWSTHDKIGNRQAVQFRISHKKLKKYIK